MENPGNKNSKKGNSEMNSIDQLILERSSKLRLPEGLSMEDALARLKLRAGIGETGSVTKSLRPGSFRLSIWIAAAAAGILLLLGLWRILLYNSQTRIIAENGSVIQCKLPDGSKISLNAGSVITYSRAGFAEDRSLTLDGEAFFNVEKGSPFIVSTACGRVKVLGTTFNVFSREDLFTVSCLTGKVQVDAEVKTVVIEAGETAKLEGNELVSFRDKNISNAAGWLNGEFNFENTPLILIFNEIERQYNVKFAAQNIEDKYFTGGFDTKNLEITLEQVCSPMGLRYEIGKNGKIYISEKTN